MRVGHATWWGTQKLAVKLKKKKSSICAPPCSMSEASSVNVQFASRSQESFVLHGEEKRRREKRGRCVRGGEVGYGGSERRALASPVTCSPTLIHLFSRRGAQPRYGSRRPPTSCIARGLVYGSCLAHCVHTRALWMWRSSDSQFDSEMSEMDALSPQKSMHFVIQLLNCWQLYRNAWTCERDEKFEQLSLF